MASPGSGESDVASVHTTHYPGRLQNSTNQSTPLPHWVIPSREVNAYRDSPLGIAKGGGSVFKGSWAGSLVAVKILSSKTPVDNLLDRVQPWQSLRHPHVLQVFGISTLDTDPPFLVTQLYPNGNANEFLVKNPGADRAKIIFECILGMKYLHDRGIVHGTLNPNNVLVAENGQACVADYGMIEIKPSGNPNLHRYFSPEAWKGTVSRPSDVFAFAMSAFEIFTSAPPWGVLSETQIYQLVVREGDRPDRPEPEVEDKVGLTDRIWEVIEVAWRKESRLRPTFAQVLEMWPPRDQGTRIDTTSERADSPLHNVVGKFTS
ncbi:hypothetical protein JAAARDRAFT_324033 [Jaapia argillacea MUCL 33604]|uniref:Protein kinase domain-containing protein n=1 Tax=Jaapia argillacea MUCL 33604 TaxID=933084 RepID=A0A067PLC7_9AGAM|nr:hypothetical protein JAAARDRAFT_324033 [Jaapia argillacea MUCL 33604]